MVTHLSENVLVNPIDLPKVGPGDLLNQRSESLWLTVWANLCVNLTIKGGYFLGQSKTQF